MPRKSHILGVVRRVARAAYPEHMRRLGEWQSWRDLAEHCEGTPDVWIAADEQAYCIVCRETGAVVDLAATRPLTMAEMRAIMAWIGPGEWYADLRATTSWPLVAALARRWGYTVAERDRWDWEGVEMVSASVTIPQSNRVGGVRGIPPPPRTTEAIGGTCTSGTRTTPSTGGGQDSPPAGRRSKRWRITSSRPRRRDDGLTHGSRPEAAGASRWPLRRYPPGDP